MSDLDDVILLDSIFKTVNDQNQFKLYRWLAMRVSTILLLTLNPMMQGINRVTTAWAAETARARASYGGRAWPLLKVLNFSYSKFLAPHFNFCSSAHASRMSLSYS